MGAVIEGVDLEHTVVEFIYRLKISLPPKAHILPSGSQYLLIPIKMKVQ